MGFRRRHQGLIIALIAAVWFAHVPGPATGEDAKPVTAADKQLMAANGLLQRGLFELAAGEYEEFLAQHGGHAEATTARYALAICRYRLNDPDKAIDQLNEVLKQRDFKQRDEALAVLAHCQLVTGKADDAAKAYEQLLRDHADSRHAEPARLNLAQAQYQLKRYDEAAGNCRKFIESYPRSTRRSTAEYLLALSLHQGGKSDQAQPIIDALLQQGPANPHYHDALLLAGQTQEAKKNWDEAAKRFRQFVEAAPNARKSEGYYSLGLLLHRAGRYDQAIDTLKALLDRHGDQPYAGPGRLQLGLSQYAADQFDQAAGTFAQVEKHDPGRKLEASFWIAQCDMARKRYAPAKQRLEQLLKHDPPPGNLPEVMFHRAMCSLAMEQWSDAAGQFAEFVKRYPKDASRREATYRQAFALHRMDRYDESLKLCSPIAKADGDRIALLAAQLAAENQYRKQDYGEAEKRFAELIDAMDDGSEQKRMRLRYGQCAYFSGNHDQAIERLAALVKDEATDRNTQLAQAVLLTGDAQLHRKRFDEAGKLVERYLKSSGADALQARYKLAVAKWRDGKADEAQREFEQVVRGDGQSVWVQRGLLDLGQLLYRDRGRAGEAKPRFEKLLTLKPDKELEAPARYLLGWIAFDGRKFDEAGRHFTEVAEKFWDQPVASDAAYHSAVALKESGKFDEALAWADRYLQRYREGEHEQNAELIKGIALARLKRYDESVKLLEELARRAKQAGDVLRYELAWAWRGKGDDDKAIGHYEQLLREHGRSDLAPAARAELAELLYRKNRFAEARKLLDQVRSDKQADEATKQLATFRLAWCFTRLDEHDRAAKLFADYAERGRDEKLRATATYQAGVAESRLNRHESAQKHFERFLRDYADHELAPVVHLKLGEVLAARDMHEQARDIYQKYLSTFKDHEFKYLAQFGVGWSLENQDQSTEARKWYARVIESHNGPTAARAQFQLGETYFNEGKFELAARELLKVDIVYDYPQWSAKALYEAGRAFEQLGQTDKAKQQFRLCIKKYQDESVSELAKKALATLGG